MLMITNSRGIDILPQRSNRVFAMKF